MVWRIILVTLSIIFSCNSFAMLQCPKDPIEAEKLFDRWVPGKKNQLICYGCGSEDIEPVSCLTCCLPLHQKYVHPDFYYYTETTPVKKKILKKVTVNKLYATLYKYTPTYVDGYESITTVSSSGNHLFTRTKPRIMGGQRWSLPQYKEVEEYVEEWVEDPTRKHTQHCRFNDNINLVYAITEPRSYKTILEEITKKAHTIPENTLCMGCLHQCHYDDELSTSMVCDSNTNYVFDIPMKQCKCFECLCYTCCAFRNDAERSDIEKGLSFMLKQCHPAIQDFVDLKVISKFFEKILQKNGQLSEPATLF